MIIGFGNNVVSSLAADITATQTTIQVMPGAGALFAGLLTYDYANDSNSLKVYAKITLTDAKETVFEVCHLTAVNNDMLTVVRGQEGTAAKGWSLNDVIANFATRGSENQFVQIEQLQSGHYTSAVAGGTANGLTLALPATYFLNGSTDWALKTPILIYPTLNNTGASTMQLTMGGRVMGTYPLVKGSNTALRAGDIVAKNPFLAVFNADQGRFIVLNPTTDVGSVRTVNSIGPDVGGNVKLRATDVGALPIYPDALAVDLNTLGATALAGVYCQPLNSGATTANHYPINAAGSLVLTPSAYGCQQEYTEYGGARKFVRSLTAMWNGKDGPWSVWHEYYGDVHKPTAADVNAYTKQEADGRFVYKSGDTIAALNVTKGLYVGEDITVNRTLFVDGVDFINKRKYFEFNDGSANHRQTSGLHLLGAGDQYADLMFDEVIGQYAALRVHTRSAGSDGWYEFRHDGTFNASSTVGAGGGNGSKMHPDGNIWGTAWGGYLKDFLNNKVNRDEFQSGVNGNGSWTKFPGGGMWCRHNLNLNANGVTTWTFPASFPNTPGVYMTSFNGEFKCWLNGAGSSNCSIYNNGPALNINIFAVW